tara:strand:+ start:3454 stop:3747 length:294 start_codon:yes stop_codon:yes gene_type:complete
VETITGKPYIDCWVNQSGVGVHYRTFYADKPDSEFVWHRDHNDRELEILEGEGWQIQFEGSLPYLLNDIKEVFIPAGVYHRLIKGYNNLKVKINEVI